MKLNKIKIASQNIILKVILHENLLWKKHLKYAKNTEIPEALNQYIKLNLFLDCSISVILFNI